MGQVALELGPDEWRVAYDVAASLHWQQRGRVRLQCMAVKDMRRVLERYSGIVEPESLMNFIVGDMDHHPHGHLGDARRKFLEFDAVELIDRDARQQRRVDLLFAVLRAQSLQPPDFAIGDDEEIAATARRIEKRQPGELGLEPRQCARSCAR